MTTFEKVYDLVAKIKKGNVSTYGRIAKLVRINPRTVGYILHQNKDPKNVPCHRIIKSDGSIAKGYAFGGLNAQRELLEKEGINFENDKIDLSKFEFKFNSQI